MDEATQAYAALMRAYPDLTINRISQAMVFSDTMLDRMVTNQRMLGKVPTRYTRDAGGVSILDANFGVFFARRVDKGR